MIKGVFYSHFGCDPYFNMAADEWLFARGCVLPGSVFLRLYTWNTGTITFGANQKLETALDMSKIGDTPLIRRITGGRALFHDPSEITYCIVINREGLLNSAINTSQPVLYEAISHGLVCFLRQLGIEADYCRRSAARNAHRDFFNRAPCFASHAKYEVISGNGKLVASAARRYGATILQHGAIKIGGLVHHPALNFGDTLQQSVDVDPQPVARGKFEMAAKVLCKQMSECLQVRFQSQQFSPEEVTEVFRQSETLNKKALIRRDSFKHRSCTISLLHSGCK